MNVERDEEFFLKRQIVETDIDYGKFKVGDKVKRPIDVYAPIKRWRYKYGIVVRAYKQTGSPYGDYSQLYDVLWNGKNCGKAYLPHGIDLAD